MDTWSILLDILIVLTAALVLGTLAELYRQSAIVGYLLAGALVGPHSLRLVHSPQSVESIAEVGVALLLFTIGLEFSYGRLRQLGKTGLLGGVLQVLFTTLLVGLASFACGLSPAASIVVGTMVALSSTASVLRLLSERVEIESPYGRLALAVLLLQDIAVVPLAVLASALSSGQRPAAMLWIIARTALAGGTLLLVFRILFGMVTPRLLNTRQWTANREFPILLAIIVSVGSAAAARALGISPSIGAFFAGVLLGESPFAVQMRADVASIRTLFVTLFFASIGMLAEPKWILHNWNLVGTVVTGIIIAKTVITWSCMRLVGVSRGVSLAVGMSVAQVGEFAFVLSTIARPALINEPTFRLIAASTVATLLVTPYLVKYAGPAARWMEKRGRRGLQAVPEAADTSPPQPPDDRLLVLITGFGPAGQRVAETLLNNKRVRIVVIDLNPKMLAIAERYGLETRIGNAWLPEVLHSAGIERAVVVVVTVPDPSSSRQIIDLCRSMNPQVKVAVRARYHAMRWELQMAGAWVVADEEELVGIRLAVDVRRALMQISQS